MILETPRLLLRPFRDGDAPDVYAYARDPRVGPIALWPSHATVAESLAVIRTVFASPGVFAMVEKTTGRVVGSVGFVGNHPAGEYPDCPDDEIGYALSPAYWGRGLTGEAVSAVLRYGFTVLCLQRIWCGHYAGNWRFRRCMEKCGFRYQFARTDWVATMGEYRQSYFYLLTKEAWREGVSGTL
ncbi:GNAT family N-acetyltransferase [Oscillibacter sp.]|uniref:GNAT family N-acetyltransferase n=1 Tax=Oscillibacter sp. TaxID=1945593 RepID=UPI00262E2BE5|nr:GNAT family N-acetyltransferase [Oscillibacter sp.]MDD3346851.1 GNAT family N-acetyltransferase [Oscillibacter sp.]